MKSKDLQNLKGKTVAELEKQVREKVSGLNKLRTELMAGKHKNVRVVKNTRQDIARIYTILVEKKLLEKGGNV